MISVCVQLYLGSVCIQLRQVAHHKAISFGSRSPKYLELNHFTLLFCRERQRNVPRFKTHVHSYCLAH